MIFIRADANSYIGTGHVMRCLSNAIRRIGDYLHPFLITLGMMTQRQSCCFIRCMHCLGMAAAARRYTNCVHARYRPLPILWQITRLLLRNNSANKESWSVQGIAGTNPGLSEVWSRKLLAYEQEMREEGLIE